MIGRGGEHCSVRISVKELDCQIVYNALVTVTCILAEKDNSSSGFSAAPLSGSNKTPKSFLAGLHPSRWGSRATADKGSPVSADGRGVSTASLLANYREKIKTWISSHGMCLSFAEGS